MGMIVESSPISHPSPLCFPLLHPRPLPPPPSPPSPRVLQLTEQEGIVFIDEIDKIVSSSDFSRGVDASAEGVQRDLLPIIEGRWDALV